VSTQRDRHGENAGQASAEQAAILAFDVGGTRIKAGLVRGAEIAALHVEPLSKVETAPDLVQALVQLGARMREDVSVQAVGISMKGLVDPQQGILLDVNETWAHLIGKPFAQPLSQAFGLPVFVENDARMYTVGEMLYGAARDVENVLCLTLGTGIGSGVALQRRVLRGPRGFSGILGGHITVQIDGPRCTCGNIGCLEAFIGTAPLVRKAADLARTQYGNEPAQDPLTPHAIFNAALAGDALAREVVAYFTRYLSAGVVSLIHAHDPDLVVLGGGIAEASAQFLPALQSYIDEHTWTLPRGRVHVTRAELGDTAALLGIAALAQGLDVLL
jgi:glucokinase